MKKKVKKVIKRHGAKPTYTDAYKKKVAKFYKKHTQVETMKEFNVSSASVHRWSVQFRDK